MLPWFDEGIAHIWRPYTQMQTALPPLPIISAQGCELTLADGRTLVDGVASWWSVCHGYRHPDILRAVEKQLNVLPHVMFGGLAHEPALTLAKQLCEITPPGLSRVFFSDSGSVAVEVAMKMALQYWKNQGKQGKDRFLCFTHGYHGDTFGAMAVSDPQRSMHRAFRHSVIHHYVVDIPSDEYSFAELDSLLSGIHKELAGTIIEPLVQGAGGMKFHSPDVLAGLHALAKKHGLLFIADEIATGFGRTGSMFACAESGISPDILCLGKALSAGTLPLAATLATEEIFGAFLSDQWEHALMHGPTFMANPLACAAALASLEIFAQEPRLKQVEAIEAQLREELEECRSHPAVQDVRVRGAIGVVQVEESRMDQATLNRLREHFVAQGAWVRPFGDILYLTPPLTISPPQLQTLTRAICSAVKTLSR